MLILMQVSLIHIGSVARSKDELGQLTDSYMKKSSAFSQCRTESFRSETQFLDWLTRQQGRTAPVAVLLDSKGSQMTSENLAAWVRERRDDGTQHLVFAIGPADGWSSNALNKARLKLSLGTMTMAHSLARLVMAEQIYRISTILTGHPYHTGH
ncbi:MAG TPA: 23S rRNA (pseudouridine(1915)-N(3))-methyltransferase RlmH [Terracidiphilus sp.]|nr:23S rRNA (pseudouridine(1915)-N(3))-methyltransferase RlmH [Terracidiphilus sp.]